MRGFTLPIWVTAAAKAAAQVLTEQSVDAKQRIDFSNNQDSIFVPIRSAALLDSGEKAIAISNCDSAEGLDLTSDLEIWTCIEFIKINQENPCKKSFAESERWLKIIPGYGVGKNSSTHKISISEFARELLTFNLYPFYKKGYLVRLEIIFPFGKQLAKKTSNHAFGVVDGLALIGTQIDVQVSASPQQLQKTIESLRGRCLEESFSGSLTFVIGENGFNLALDYGILPNQIIKTGNWLGPLLVAAAEEKVKELFLFGYHGKLIKLAGGVFHTHHHLADNRLETLIALAFKEGISSNLIKGFESADSIEEALLILERNDLTSAKRLWARLAFEVEKRSKQYLQRYVSSSIEIGALMFDRKRKLRWAGPYAFNKMKSLGLKLED